MRILVLMLISISLMAQPNPTTITGTISHKSNVTVTGTSFGTDNQAVPIVWDACDASSTSDLSTHYPIDTWPKDLCGGTLGENPNAMAYRSSFCGISSMPHSNVTKFLCAAATTCDGSWDSEFANNVVTAPWGYDTVYVNYYYRMSPDWSLETNPSAGDNLKEFSFNGGSGTYLEGLDTYIDWTNSATPMITYPGLAGWRGSPTNYVPNPMGVWVKIEIYGNGTDSVTCTYSVPDSSFMQDKYYDWGGDGIRHADGDPPEGLSLGGFTRWPRADDENHARYWTGIFMNNTYSRVMLGNASTWANCDIREPQIITSWSDTSIDFDVNLGAITGTSYLYVFDNSNTSNATGLEFTASVPTPPVDKVGKIVRIK